MEVITRTEIFNFIWSQPIYFSIPLLLLFIVFCALVVFGGYSMLAGILKNAEEISEHFGWSYEFTVIVIGLSYIALFIALTFTNLFK